MVTESARVHIVGPFLVLQGVLHMLLSPYLELVATTHNCTVPSGLQRECCFLQGGEVGSKDGGDWVLLNHEDTTG